MRVVSSVGGRVMNIAIIGCGYVGLVTGACLARSGWSVNCIDKDHTKISTLQRGGIPIYEPGLESLVQEGQQLGRLTFTTDLGHAIISADVVFIAVGTPTSVADGQSDLTGVFQAVREIAEHLREFTVVVIKSTVPVGTGDKIEHKLQALRPDGCFPVVSNPEFLREGTAISDFLAPDRVIVGVENARAANTMRTIYYPIVLERFPLVITRRRTAELIKYAANAFLVTKITFINEIADLCERLGANVQDVALGIGLDSRIGSKFLQAGPGYGGSCFPKDTLAVLKLACEAGARLRMVETAVAVNEERKGLMVGKIMAACGGRVKGKRLAVLGLTFKPDTDDVRESPAIAILQLLQEKGAQIIAYDPQGMVRVDVLPGGLLFADDAYSAMRGADALVVLTDWREFYQLDLVQVRALLREPIVVDLRNVFAPEAAAEAGLIYYSVGRPRMERLVELASVAAE